MLVRCFNIHGESPLPLWERVGVRGYGLSIIPNPSPGSHLRCDIAEASLRRSFPRTAAEGGLCLSHKGRGGRTRADSKLDEPEIDPGYFTFTRIGESFRPLLSYALRSVPFVVASFRNFVANASAKGWFGGTATAVTVCLKVSSSTRVPGICLAMALSWSRDSAKASTSPLFRRPKISS